MRVLVAEDETIIRLDLRDLLERAGFEVCAEARDGAEAVESPQARWLPPPRRVPSPACVAILGRARLALGETVRAAALTPLYLRPSEAELRRRVAADR